MKGFLNLFRKKQEEKKEEQKQQLPQFLYSEAELNEYDAYIFQNIGEYQSVFHEIVSTDIHLDVVIIPPVSQRPYYRLVTMGAGVYRMNVPEELKQETSEYAEYIIDLPADWNINSAQENDYWPIRALKNTARLPIFADTWLGFGHSISQDAEGSPYADNTRFNSILLTYANGIDGKPPTAKLSSGKSIAFYQLVPLYPEELAFKQENDAADLLEQLVKEPDYPLVNIHRSVVGEN